MSYVRVLVYENRSPGSLVGTQADKFVAIRGKASGRSDLTCSGVLSEEREKHEGGGRP